MLRLWVSSFTIFSGKSPSTWRSKFAVKRRFDELCCIWGAKVATVLLMRWEVMLGNVETGRKKRTTQCLFGVSCAEV